MVVKLTGKQQPTGKVANKPSGKPSQLPVKKIETPYSKAKQESGRAEAPTR